MSFARASYDRCAYEQRQASSQGPGEYKLNSPVDVPCLVYAPESGSASYGGGSRAERARLVDVDSELMGITRPYSKCKRPYDCSSSSQPVHHVQCRVELEKESTRLSNPPCTLRCNGVNRWQTLCHDPQKVAILPFQTLVNNRIVVKDNHRPCVEVPLDQTAALPPQTRFEQPSWPGRLQDPMLPSVNHALCRGPHIAQL